MKLSIIIPCYNEEKTIKPLLQKLFDINFPIDYEIIIIDDGSKINHKNIPIIVASFLKKVVLSGRITKLVDILLLFFNMFYGYLRGLSRMASLNEKMR